jgi:hypothetical protein
VITTGVLDEERKILKDKKIRMNAMSLLFNLNSNDGF